MRKKIVPPENALMHLHKHRETSSELKMVVVYEDKSKSEIHLSASIWEFYCQAIKYILGEMKNY